MTTVRAPWSTHDPTANQRPGIGSRDAASANGGTGPRAGSLSASKCVQEWDTGDANCEEMKTLSPHPGLNTNIDRWGDIGGLLRFTGPGNRAFAELYEGLGPFGLGHR